MAKKRSSGSMPLNTLAVWSHKELEHKGFDTSFHKPLNTEMAGNGLELGWKPQLVLDADKRQMVALCCRTLKDRI